ncbi:MAG: T9SS type A sorting domain-containing protein, partial [Bacteroidales bacterium]|nr:T9SS type A sorting domain-containing protein [Bacteroidales bacterium]
SFTGITNYGIYNAGPQNINYYNSTVGLDPSLIYGSVTQHYGATSGGCFFSWDTIGTIVDPEPIKTEGDSTGDNAPQDPPKALQMGGNASVMGAEDVLVFPNPNNGQFSIHSSQSTIYRIRLYDVYGKLLKTVNVNASMAEVDVHELCAGVYVLRVETDSGAVVKRVVKE